MMRLLADLTWSVFGQNSEAGAPAQHGVVEREFTARRQTCESLPNITDIPHPREVGPTSAPARSKMRSPTGSSDYSRGHRMNSQLATTALHSTAARRGDVYRAHSALRSRPQFWPRRLVHAMKHHQMSANAFGRLVITHATCLIGRLLIFTYPASDSRKLDTSALGVFNPLGSIGNSRYRCAPRRCPGCAATRRVI